MDRKMTAIGSYKLTGKILGKGNFATVHEGLHTILGTKVAVKSIGKTRLQQQYIFKNLKREAQILFRLNHPNILRLYETIQHEDFYYIITELVTGRDFNTYLSMQPSGHLPENQSRKYAAQLFSAVNHLHKHFVVHRDLKLENILIDKRKDWIKLIDFGLSNTWSNKTFLSTNCGSPEYAAPELFVEGRGYGAEVDLWSLGVVLYIMASGKLPFRVKISQHESFQNNHRIALYHQITRGLTTRHFNNIKHYSEGFLQLLEKLLVPNADKRISICAALRHPWITAIKKNIVQSSWKTGLYAHQKILEEVSKIANISVVELSALLKYEPYGKLGGLYNIIAHNKMLNERNSTSPYKSNSCKCHFDNRANDDSSVYRI